MEGNMNDSQTIFSVFYAVLYGSILSSCQSLRLFPWGFPKERGEERKRLIRRLLLSIINFNIIPFIIFAFSYKYLLANINDSFINIIRVGLLSLSVFIPYRFYHLIMVYFKGKGLIYTEEEYNEIKRQRNLRESICGHLLAVLFYFSCLLIFKSLIPVILSCCIILIFYSFNE